MNGLESWLTIALAIANAVFLVGATIGGILAFRSGLANAERVIQERIREALSAENDLLRSQLERQDKEMVKFRALVGLLIETFKQQRGIGIEMESDRIVIRDGQQVLIAHLPATLDGLEKKP